MDPNSNINYSRKIPPLLDIFTQVLLLAGNHGNLKDWVPSMQPYKFWQIFIGLRQKNVAQPICLSVSGCPVKGHFSAKTLKNTLEVKNQMSHLLPFPKANFRKRFAYGNSSYLLTLRFSYIKLFLCYKNFFPDQLCFTKLTFLLLTFFTNIDLCSLIGRLLLFLILSLAHITMAVLGSVCLEAG